MRLNVKKAKIKVKAGTPEVSCNSLGKCSSFEFVKSSFLELPFSQILLFHQKRKQNTKVRAG